MSKFVEITPAAFRCSMSMACPSVFRSEDGQRYRITGANIPTDPYIAGEATVEIDAKLLETALGVSQWQPIETHSKAPYEEILVLVNDYEDKELVHRIAMWDPENDDWTVFMANWDAEPVYWMPLLAAPLAPDSPACASNPLSPNQTPETPSSPVSRDPEANEGALR